MGLITAEAIVWDYATAKKIEKPERKATARVARPMMRTLRSYEPGRRSIGRNGPSPALLIDSPPIIPTSSPPMLP